METAEITQRGRETAAGGARQARARMAETLTRRSGEAAEASRGMADDVGAVGEELRRRGRDRAADMADATAARVERLGRYLERSDGTTLMDDATRYGRHHPAMTAMAGFVVGLAAARFVKAGEQPHRAGGGSGTEGAQTGGARPGGLPAPGQRDDIRPAGSPL